MNYDLIGDIHGCADTLEALLQKLGYQEVDGVYTHPENKVIFLGDFIDRGPKQKRVIEIVQRMTKNHKALAVMGNHEFNAIAYFTYANKIGDYCRLHTEKNEKQHKAFLDAYASDSEGYAKAIAWFYELPLWLELDGLNVVHACWDEKIIEKIKGANDGKNALYDDLLINGSIKGTWEYEAIETLLKGKEIPLPDGHHFYDKEKNKRHDIRVRWWDASATTYQKAYMGPETARTTIPDDDIEGDHLVDYSHDLPPVFLGHYWLEGEPSPLAKNIACLDYSVAKPGGYLVAYRWSGEKVLSKANYVTVKRIEK